MNEFVFVIINFVFNYKFSLLTFKNSYNISKVTQIYNKYMISIVNIIGHFIRCGIYARTLILLAKMLDPLLARE